MRPLRTEEIAVEEPNRHTREGFWFNAGLGYGSLGCDGCGSREGGLSVSIDGFGSESETGGGALLGLGYDIRVGQNVSLTPVWLGFAAQTSNSDANVGQLSLGVTIH